MGNLSVPGANPTGCRGCETVARRTGRRKDLLAFLDSVGKDYPNQRLAIVLDNLNTHTNQAAGQWLKTHQLVSFHYTPTQRFMGKPHRMLLQHIDRQGLQQAVHRWFAKITTEAIRRGSFRSVKHLIEAIEAYIVEHNNEPKPFRWTATANSIFEKISASLE